MRRTPFWIPWAATPIPRPWRHSRARPRMRLPWALFTRASSSRDTSVSNAWARTSTICRSSSATSTAASRRRSSRPTATSLGRSPSPRRVPETPRSPQRPASRKSWKISTPVDAPSPPHQQKANSPLPTRRGCRVYAISASARSCLSSNASPITSATSARSRATSRSCRRLRSSDAFAASIST